MTPDHFDYALVLLRGALGIVMVAHGYNHIFRGGRIEGTAGWFESLGMRPGLLHAWFASLTELVAGPLLILGLLTPLAAAAVLGVISVAWITNHLDNGFFIFREGEGWEYVATVALTSIALGSMGPGAWSLDEAVGFEANGTVGLGLVLLGAAAAAGLLAVFWRPAPEQRKNPLWIAAVFAVYLVVGLVGLALVDGGFDDLIVEPDQLDFGVLILRIVLAVVMFAHGYNHIFRGGRIEGTARWFESLGMRPGLLHAWVASLTELGVAALLVLGLLTPLAAAGVIGVMVVAWTTNHVPRGFFTFRPGEGWEYVSFVAVAALVVGTIGGGEISLDHELELSDTFVGFNGFFVALLGVVAALGLLVVFWRPAEIKYPLGVAAVFAFFAVLAIVGLVATAAEDGAGAPEAVGVVAPGDHVPVASPS